MYFTNKFEYATHVNLVLHFSFLAFNLTLIHKNNIQLGSNLGLIVLKQSLRIKL
jgi:hypothetical protein